MAIGSKPPQLPPLTIGNEEIVPYEQQIVPLDSRIVLSFAMASGGDAFIRWIYRELMAFYSLPTPTSVYVDHIHAPSLPLTEMTMVRREKSTVGTAGRLNGITGTKTATKLTIADERLTARLPDAKRVEGRTATGNMREDWKILFRSALRCAKVVIVFLNREYIESKWCIEEMKMVNVENALRQESQRPLLRQIIVRLESPGAKPDQPFRRESGLLIGSTAPGAELIHLTKLGVRAGDALGDALFWRISPEGFALLTKTIGPMI